MCPVKYSVQVTPSIVSLNNKFQCLQDLCDSQDVDIHDEIHTTESVVDHSAKSVLAVADCVEFIPMKQRLQECKPPLSYSKKILQPLLANQTKHTLDGNKNKTGF